MSEIFAAPSVEYPNGSFYQMSIETGMLQHLDRKCRLLGEENVIGTTAHVTEHSQKKKRIGIGTLYGLTAVSGTVGALAVSPLLAFVVGGAAIAVGGSALTKTAHKSVYAEVRLEGLENGDQSIYLAEPEDAYQLADIINNFSAAEETSFLSE